MGDTTLELTDKNFEDTLKKGGILIIDFWAAWCGPCRAFAPTFEAAATKHTDIVFAKVNTDKERSLAQAFEIQSIPTLAVFRDGIPLMHQAGALPPHILEKVIEETRKLDMDVVKQKIAAEQAKHDAEHGKPAAPEQPKQVEQPKPN